MTHGREKRLLVGLLAFLAPVPLPFNEAVRWPVVLAYLAAVAWFLRRASVDPPRWLPRWGMNLLGVAYLPFFLFDVGVLGRGRLVGPVLDLCLFALVVKLFGMTRERDKWQAVLGVFFLFLAGMGTSVHPSIVLYLVGFVGLAFLLLVRFTHLHVLAGFGRPAAAAQGLPLRGFLAAAVLGSLALAVPLFAVLPRLRAPYIVGRGAPPMGSTIEAAGFTDDVTLDSIGRIRDSREVALRLQFEGEPQPDREIRFKAATHEVYQRGRWTRTPEYGDLERSRGVRFWLARGEPVEWVKMWRQPLRSSALPLPTETIVVEPTTPRLQIDRGGAVLLPVAPFETVYYRAGLAAEPVDTARGPAPLPGDASLDLSGVTPRIAELAARVMGQGPPEERIRRLEVHLTRRYDYTVDFTGRSTDDPLEDFLFVYRSGQCEYFASAMVLMLRSQGVPARLVTGFLGGEYNLFEGYYMVRDSNAHAWVEAYLPGRGWRTYDPTPAAGRPMAAEEGAWALLRQAYDYMLFRWDRYVLTFGIYDQLNVFRALRSLWLDLKGLFDRGDGDDRAATREAAPAALPEAAPEEPAETPADLGWVVWALLGAGLAVASALVLLARRRGPPSATAAYQALRRAIERDGERLPASLPPLAFHRLAARRHPEAAAPAARIVALYLRESFGGAALAAADHQRLREDLAAVAARIKAERKARRRSGGQREQRAAA